MRTPAHDTTTGSAAKLAEPRGRSPLGLKGMHWYPFVTFWQVSGDLAHGMGMPIGHGHNYTNTILDGWVAVVPPDGWTAGDTERVRAALNQDVGDSED